MNNADYKFMEDFLRRHSGLGLAANKAYLLEARLSPVAAALGYNGLEDMIAALRQQERMARMVAEAMTTNETSFFRDASFFRCLTDRLLPYYLKQRPQKQLRLWSAACSTGQEPYSIAMQLQEMAESFADWHVDLQASDLSQEAVGRARLGVYSAFEVQRGLPARLLVKYFTREGDKWQVSENIRRRVSFRQMNLLSPSFQAGMPKFDIIFCRNALMYFAPAEKQSFLSAARDWMREDSVLVLGQGEIMPAQSPFRPLEEAAGVFLRADSPAKI